MAKGHDGAAAPHGKTFGEPIMELPLGAIDTEALGPTLLVMQNLPSIVSLAASLVGFIKAWDLEDELLSWMYGAMCEKHRGEVLELDIPTILTNYRDVLNMYLDTLGMSSSGCSHDEEENNG